MSALVEHVASGFKVDTASGHIYGKRGELVGSLGADGYIRVSYGTRRMGTTSATAHRIVFEAAHGDIPEGLEIHHRNHVKTDNRIDNLTLVTHQENVRATSDLFAKLPEADELSGRQIRDIVATRGRVTAGEWSEVLGVSAECVEAIRVKTHIDAAAFARGLQ